MTTQNEQPTIQERLAEQFPAAVERTLTKSGARLTYIPVSEVITRMNQVVGLENWSSEVVSVQRDGLDPDFVIAHVRVKALINGQVVTRDGVGGQPVKRKKSGEIVDLGDEFKGAVSDAFKKACQQFGIALYLARTEEAMLAEVEAEVSEAERRSAELYATLKTHLDAMAADAKAELKAWWAENYPGLGAPSTQTHAEPLTAAIGWCVERQLAAA